MNKEIIIEAIENSRETIITNLKQVIIDDKFNYRTFGTSIEDPLFDIVVNILKEKKLITNDEQYKRAKDKNEFPDLTIHASPDLALELKSGNRVELNKRGEWITCKNSANDLGTINTWEKKIQQFGGDNIFFIFIEYSFTDKNEEIIDVKIDHFYKFVGLNKASLLSYREKDGNLRPKDFDAESPVKSLRQFMSLFPQTRTYRAKRLVKKHLADLSEEERAEILSGK